MTNSSGNCHQYEALMHADFTARYSKSNSNLLKQQRAKSHLQVAKTMIKHATYAYYI